MKSAPPIGATATLDLTVGGNDVIHLGSWQPRSAVVFSTPAMINLMEHAARNALMPFLEPTEESVGVNVHIEHLAATPINASVRAEAKVVAIDGRLIDFEVSASDAKDVIGKGTHRRAVVQIDRMVTKLVEKTASLPEGVVVPMSVTPNTGPLPRFATVLVDCDGPIATVTLNRPLKLNAVDRQMTGDLEQVNSWLAGHPEVRVVILTGAGEAFCAGDDVKEVGTLDLAEAAKLSHRQAELYLTWERLPQVFIGAINGAAFGAGCVCACSCDFRIAAHSARFGMPEIRLGWAPGYGLAQLTALVGKVRALELCLTGEPITAQQAVSYGLANDVVPLSRVMPAVREFADRLLAQPIEALRLTKQLIHGDEGSQPKRAYLADTAAYIHCLGQADAREGIKAFNEKRPPKFGNSSAQR